MIRRLLIANRGEIALRVIRACRELGIETVAVYSEPDAAAPHVAAAVVAVAIGPAAASASYLSIPAIVDAAKAAGADAVHPGYGFLSENESFAAACADAGLTFVGPPARVIARMGSKIEARRLMQKAGVPVVPGETPDDQTDDGLRATVERVGLPVLIKASAGGGGKGMRTVREAAEVTGAIQAARREATAAFGDGTLYVERLVEEPRHIEVQVFGDAHGHVVHVFERECSVQRRHQKVIEESPSPVLTPALRARITEAAVQAARAAEYLNAGTIEFLLDGSGDAARFYFLEMNTRLQVEHPVTEQVAGVDLVRAQLLVAAGEPLPWTQEQLTQRGHAIEARVYAEDPSEGFIPQAGRILLYREPRLPGVRIDAGIAEGSEVSVHYDPMLAKVIATAETRDLAIARLTSALRHYPILGIRTNVPFLLRILEHPRFRNASIHTGFLDAEGAALAERTAGAVPDDVQAALDAHDESPAAAGASQASSASAWDPWQQLKGWRS
jgi:acetyl-CoA carboxylase biotin carboxylase subunit